MRGAEQRPDAAELAAAHQVNGLQDAMVLGDHVPGPAAQHRVGEAAYRVLGVVDVPQRADAKGARRGLALAAPGRVAAVGQGVAGAGIDDQQGEASGGRVERHRGGLSTAAVEQQGMAGPAEQGGGLIHDPGRHADEAVLRALRERGQFGPWHVNSVQLGQGERDPAFQRRGRGQASALRQVRVDRQASPADGVTGFAQCPGDSRRVGRPTGHLAWRQPVQGHGDTAVGHLHRSNVEHAATGQRGGRERSPVQREREHEPLVVVGVLTDQVRPAGGVPEAVWVCAEALPEPGNDPVCVGGPSHQAMTWVKAQASATIERS